MPAPLRVQVIRGWPRRFEVVDQVLPAGAAVADAVAASGFGAEGISGFAIHRERAVASTLLRDGDRVELLRPLEVDPTEARRRRAAGGSGLPLPPLLVLGQVRAEHPAQVLGQIGTEGGQDRGFK